MRPKPSIGRSVALTVKVSTSGVRFSGPITFSQRGSISQSLLATPATCLYIHLIGTYFWRFCLLLSRDLTSQSHAYRELNLMAVSTYISNRIEYRKNTPKNRMSYRCQIEFDTHPILGISLVLSTVWHGTDGTTERSSVCTKGRFSVLPIAEKIIAGVAPLCPTRPLSADALGCQERRCVPLP